jgi:membrane protein implicated in regulation of membrane protease activity
MQVISGLISQFGAWLWFAVAVALIVLETVVPGIHFLWFGLAAAAVGVLALLMPLSMPWQLVLFALISVATVFWVRRYGRADVAKTDEPQLNIRGAQYIGRKVIVEDAIRNGRGKVRVGDTIWAAEGEDAPRGSEVEVTGVNGTVLVVSRTDEDWAETK